jgi:hypothetical protein
MKQRIINTVAFIALLTVGVPCLRAAVHSQSKPEEIEWTWEARPTNPVATLPNVLLEGDSLSRNYFPEVQRLLAGKANVYLMASSICVGDPRLPKEIVMFAKMEGVRFRIVHFNNGAHGIDYSEAQYKAGFPAYLAALRSIAPHGTLIWATTTPLKSDSGSGVKNARIDARNAIAENFVRGMMVDDQHALMEKHQELYLDNVHFNTKGSNIMGAQVADVILRALEESARAER